MKPNHPIKTNAYKLRKVLSPAKALVVLTFLSLSVGIATAHDEAGEWKTVRMRVTAYCPCEKCCGDWADGVTANGHRINQGDRFVAADRRYSFGTALLIPGYNNSQPVKVLDRGGAIKGNKLDVFFNTHQEALIWGVQYLDVKVKLQ
jgi:3D (Asp-Asp-Asp) domain-containing protein